MLPLIALSAFLTVLIAVLAFAQRSPNPLDARVEALGRSTGGVAPPSGLLLSDRRLSPLSRGAVQIIRSLLPGRWFERLRRSLIAAGDPIDPGLFLLLWVTIGGGMAILGAVLLGARGLVLLGVLGSLLPLMWLRRTARHRRQRIVRALPDAMDLLVVCVEAGLGLDAAMIRVGEATEGPLGAEIRLTLAEISVGRPRQEALLELGTRSGVADLDGFLRPVIQAERAGVSIGEALRVQAESLRERRRQRARESAEKIPAKMTIPMVAFFLPTIMLVAVAPAVLTLSKVFAGLGG
jgi:tight adherence protein C